MTRPRRSTLIRQARQAVTAAKRSEIFGNKKPGIAPGILNFECSRQALPGPGCELFTHHRPVHEQCIFLK